MSSNSFSAGFVSLYHLGVDIIVWCETGGHWFGSYIKLVVHNFTTLTSKLAYHSVISVMVHIERC